MVLFRIIRNSGLTDYIDFDLTRIFHVCFNLLGNISCQNYHISISDLFRNYHHANFSACLNGIRITDPFKTVGDFF